MKAQVLANAWQLVSCIQNHSQCTKPVNSTPIVVDTLETAVYIRTIIHYYIKSVGPKVCDYLLLLLKIVILKT